MINDLLFQMYPRVSEYALEGLRGGGREEGYGVPACTPRIDCPDI